MRSRKNSLLGFVTLLVLSVSSPSLVAADADDVQLVPTDNLLVKGKTGRELERLLGKLKVEELLNCKQAFGRNDFTITADSRLRPSLHFWISYSKDLGEVAGLKDAKLDTTDLIVAHTREGHHVFSGAVAQGVLTALTRTESKQFACNQKMIGGSATYPGFPRTVCLIK